MSSRITLRQLHVFVAVARSGSVSAAARELGLSQSATSQALTEFERQLGVSVAERLGRRLELNAVGQRLLSRAEQLLDDVDLFESEAREPDGPLSGELRLSASATVGSYLMPSIIGGFTARYPDVRLDLKLRNTYEVIDSVRRFEADLGLIEGICHHRELISVPWQEDRLVIIAAPDHPLAATPNVSAQALSDADWVLREEGSGTRAVFEAAIHDRLGRLNIRLELGQHEAIKQAVRAGLGLGCLSELAVREELEQGTLVELCLDGLSLKRHFYMVWHASRYRSPVWQAFKVHLDEIDHAGRAPFSPPYTAGS
ncbi:LysR family transcriptional regulator [Larsenimonas rhizosphaerae]|uniref:LysR family transcriptional regulator n=1 Tax=Larsenimonas rhizosphaerae TaxID=2944682 RepID=A0AA42CTR2_9GAMM|nr:LysR family transcriptional regulator [Larsenimonas rhizosphaerae]MCM2130815.1 LysR family transcriptional regulator [Larsenimonas rhizosphaerae]MCX2523519.1 LysR family transcriptional regulator [Larsenimonas rhizosphaerae]